MSKSEKEVLIRALEICNEKVRIAENECDMLEEELREAGEQCQAWYEAADKVKKELEGLE